MARGDFNRYRGKMPMADMNVVPLVDVMLVLLVIFIVTAPLLTHSVKIELPKASSSPNITRPEHIEFGIRETASSSGTAKPLPSTPLPRASPPKPPGSPSRKCISAPTAMCATTWWPG
jgi:biopolymer transport protein ExbD